MSLARTLANAPDVLLLDEPTSALDDASERSIEELVLSIMIFAASSITALAITLLLRARAFSPAEQLLLRRGAATKSET